MLASFLIVVVVIFQVNEECNLSPGKFLQSYGTNINSKRKKTYERCMTKTGKRNRRLRKEMKFQHEAGREVREGPTYATGVALQENQEEDLETIPSATTEPIITTVEKNATEIVFDLETTGRGVKPDIIQIAAKNGDDIFSVYVRPSQGYIPQNITDLTGISMRDNNMFSKGERVNSVSIKEGLSSFIDFLPDQCMLVAHNTHQFDTRIILSHMKDHSFLDKFKSKVLGFLDTLPLAKLLYPERKGARGYKQEALVNDLVQETYDAHNAIADVSALHKLLSVIKQSSFTNHIFLSNSMSVESAVGKLEHQLFTRQNFETMQRLVHDKVMSEQMAKKAAASGLTITHLKRASTRSSNGIKDLFSEYTAHNKPRVTRAKAIYDRVQEYMEKL